MGPVFVTNKSWVNAFATSIDNFIPTYRSLLIVFVVARLCFAWVCCMSCTPSLIIDLVVDTPLTNHIFVTCSQVHTRVASCTAGLHLGRKASNPGFLFQILSPSFGQNCETKIYSLFAYSRFACSRFAYFRPKSGVFPTLKKQNMNALFSMLNNIDISVCRHSLYIFL